MNEEHQNGHVRRSSRIAARLNGAKLNVSSSVSVRSHNKNSTHDEIHEHGHTSEQVSPIGEGRRPRRRRSVHFSPYHRVRIIENCLSERVQRKKRRIARATQSAEAEDASVESVHESDGHTSEEESTWLNKMAKRLRWSRSSTVSVDDEERKQFEHDWKVDSTAPLSLWHRVGVKWTDEQAQARKALDMSSNSTDKFVDQISVVPVWIRERILSYWRASTNTLDNSETSFVENSSRVIPQKRESSM